MLNIVLLSTLWLCIWCLGSKERECKALVKQLMNSNDKIDELDDTIIELEDKIKDLEDEVFDLKEQGGLFNESC